MPRHCRDSAYRSFALALALAVLLVTLVPVTQGVRTAQAVSNTVVISQVYGGGGNSGAPFTNDYIELFNRGTTPVTLTGWSVQYTSAAGTGNFSGGVTTLTGTLAPGQHYLVQQAAGSATPAALPTPDATGTTNMSGTAGKVILANVATGLACNGGSTACTPAQLAQIVDLVGYGGANFFEGAPTAVLSNTTAAIRGTNGCTETDTNNTDFAVAAPAPRNTASPLTPCSGGGGPTNPSATGTATPASVLQGAQTLLTVAVTPGANPVSSGIAVNGDLSTIGGPAVQPFLDDGQNGDAALGDNIFSFRATVGAATPTGPKTLPVAVTDAQSRTASAPISLSVTTTAATRIREIQGASQRSPLAGQQVFNVPGVVTAKRSNGFYLQDDAPDTGPGSAQASSGVFVFTNSAPAATIEVGERVTVSGTVTEFIPGTTSGCNPSVNNLPLTEITVPVVTETNQIATLPAPIVVGAGGRVPPAMVLDNDSPTRIDVAATPPLGVYNPAEDGIDFWGSLEGMRVQINNARAVGPTINGSLNNINEIAVVPDDGQGFGLMTERGGIKLRANDFNPERIFLDDGIVAAADFPDVNVGAKFPGATIGLVDYSFCNFKLVVSTLPTPTGGVTREATELGGGQKLTFASFNVENLSAGDPTNNPDSKFQGLAETIVTRLRAPDLITLEEIQDNNATASGVVAADATYAKLISFITAANGPTYAYRQIDPEANEDGGAPGGNIRVGFLFRTDRGLSFVPRVTGGLDCATGSPTPAACATTATTVQNVGGKPQLSLSPGRILDSSAGAAFENSRKPLVGEFLYRGKTLFVLANHFNSKGGDEALFGRFQPQNRGSEVQRHKQAALVNQFVASILAIDPQAYVLLGGDINDFEFSETMNILRTGSASNAGNEELVNLFQLLPENERYSYVFEGNSQSLDHILVSPAVFSAASPELDVVHTNAEFFDQQSDHDPQVARFNIEGETTPPVTTSATTPAAPPSPTGWFTADVGVTLTATDESGGSGVKEIVYSATGAQVIAPTTVPGATASFSITAEGSTTVSFFARDNAGNAETAKTLTLMLDKTPPTTTSTTTPNSQNVTVALAATDPATGSGVKEIVYSAAGAQVIAPTTVPGAAASFQVTTAGTTTVSFFARDNAGNAEATKTVTVGATTGRPEGQLTPDVVDFGDTPIGTPSAERTITLSNTGVTPLVVSALALDGPNAAEFTLVSPAAPVTIAAGQSQPIVVRFTPAAAGPRTARLVVTDDAPGERRVALRGVGQGSEAAIAPDRVGFGRVLLNTTAPARMVTVFNTGLLPLRVTAVTVSGPDAAAFPLSGLPTLPADIPAGSSVTFSVAFKPTVLKGYTARIAVAHSGIGEVGVPLNGTGVNNNPGGGSQGRPEANLTPDRLFFGDVPLGTTSDPRTVMLTNTGDAPMSVNAIALGGGEPGDYAVTAPPLPAALAPGASMAIQVRFTPTARGQRAAHLSITDDAAGESRTALRGLGQTSDASITPDRIQFGQVTVGASLSRTATVTNTGLAPLHISAVSIEGDPTGDFSVTPAGEATVAPAGTLSLTVTCTPKGIGNRVARLIVTDDGTGERRVALICTGKAP